MDVYHKILQKLFQITGGKQSESVDFVELVKEEGFYPSYEDIHRQMSRAGWISDIGRGDKVKITHWGIKEARKTQSGGPDSSRETKKLATRLKEEVKELLVMAEVLVSEMSEDSYKEVEAKLESISRLAGDLKEKV